jgi:hypothetical protein
VKSSVQANLQLIDLQGRMIRQQNVDLFAGLNQINLELDGMQNGYYFIRVTSEGSSFDKPLVISR